MNQGQELDQLKLISEYVKFHIGLYLATPPVLAFLAEHLCIQDNIWYLRGIATMIVIYIISGISAGLFMGEFVNARWTERSIRSLGIYAFSFCRRFIQHWLYWIGLACGFLGILAALIKFGES